MKVDKIWIHHAVTHGVVLGISLSVIEFAALYLGLIFKPALFNIFVLLITLSVYIAIRKYRETHLKGLISFGDAFMTGLFICGISGLIWAIYRYFQYTFTPGLLEEIVRENTSVFEKSNISVTDKELYIKLYKSITKPVTIAVLNTFLLGMVAGGSLISLFLSYILQRKELPKLNEF
jgi:hypothetical protein